MKKARSKFLVINLFLCILCASTLIFCVVDFFVPLFQNAYALPLDGGLGGDQNNEYDQPGTGGGISWNTYTNDEPIPDLPSQAYQSLSGSGTKANPYKIYGQQNFNAFLDKANSRNGATSYVYGKIMNDFSFTASDYITNMRNTFVESVEEYGGIYLDGNYKRISLYIDVDVENDSSRSIGLIGSIYFANIWNLKVTGKIDVTGDSVESVGGLIGCCPYSIIENCYIAPNISVKLTGSPDRSTYVAGIVGMTATFNGNSDTGILELTDSVFGGKLDLDRRITKYGPFYTGGCSTKTQLISNKNSTYKYHKIIVADGVSVMNETVTSYVTTFFYAYSDYKVNGNKDSYEVDYVDGKWDSYPYSTKYYYSAPPNILWLINRNGIKSTTFQYRVTKDGASYINDTLIAYVGDLSGLSTSTSVISYDDFGVSYSKSLAYTVPAGYEVRSADKTESTDTITYAISLDRKVKISLHGTYIDGTNTTLDGTMVTASQSGSIALAYPDQIRFAYSNGVITISYGSQKITRTTRLTEEGDKYFVGNVRIGSTRGDALVASGNVGSLRDSLVLEDSVYVLHLYQTVALKEYIITLG